MTKNRTFPTGHLVAGALGIALLCGAGVANAQDYSAPSETITVSPTLHSSGPLMGGESGSLYSERLSMSRPVDYSDLDLTRVADARELRSRISDTARDICSELAATGDPALDDPDTDRQCVNSAIHNAILQVPGGIG